MKNEIKIELTFVEGIELRSAITTKILNLSRETTLDIRYRINTIEILMQCYDKLNKEIEINLNKEKE